MKSALLLTAMLSGLCAEVMGSPITNIDREKTAAPVIEPDLHINAEPTGELFPDQHLQKLVTTDFDQAIQDEDQFALDVNQSSGSLAVPEPPPVTLILVGTTLLGVFALWRRARRKGRRIRRRTVVHMRAIMAKR